MDEHIIEVWARSRQALPLDVRAEVERRIGQFPEWRETAEFWRGFYAALEDLTGDTTHTAKGGPRQSRRGLHRA